MRWWPAPPLPFIGTPFARRSVSERTSPSLHAIKKTVFARTNTNTYLYHHLCARPCFPSIFPSFHPSPSLYLLVHHPCRYVFPLRLHVNRLYPSCGSVPRLEHHSGSPLPTPCSSPPFDERIHRIHPHHIPAATYARMTTQYLPTYDRTTHL